MKIIENYSRKLLAKKVSGIKRKARLCSLDNARKVGILWLEGDIRAFTYLQEQCRARSIIMRHLCFAERKSETDSNVITRKDFDWLGFPKKGIIDTFIHSDFDLLLNTSVTPCYPLELITVLSAATFKAGYDVENRGIFDLTVDISKQPDALYLAEQQIHYLNELTSKL